MMISKIGGHQSVYFAGMILLVIYVVGLIPFSLKNSIVASSVIYLIYLLPIIKYDNISNKPFFIAANVFMIASSVSLFLLRYLSYKRLEK